MVIGSPVIPPRIGTHSCLWSGSLVKLILGILSGAHLMSTYEGGQMIDMDLFPQEKKANIQPNNDAAGLQVKWEERASGQHITKQETQRSDCD